MPAIPQIAGRWFDSLLQMSWQAALVVAAVLLAQWIFHRHLSPRWRYALWTLLVLRLLMPVLPASRFSVFNLSPAPPHPPAAVTLAQPEAVSVTYSEPLPTPSLEIPLALPRQPRMWNWQVIAGIGWLTGVLLLGAALLRAHARFSRRIARTATPCDPRLTALLDHCKHQMGIHGPVELVITDAVATPALMGLRHPRLLLPLDLPHTLSEAELRFVFLHELSHLKCRDIAADWFLALLRLLHWFNPVIWLAISRCRADRELARDAMVLSVTGQEHEQSYGQTLLRLVERLGQREPAIGAVGVIETRRQLKRRIQMIAHFRPNMTRDAIVAMALLLVVGFATLTGRSAQQENPAPIPPLPPTTRPTTAPSTRQAALEAALNQRMDQIVLEDAAFGDVITQLSKSANVNIIVNWREVEAAGVTPRTPISGRFRDVTLAGVIRHVLSQAAGGLGLDYVVNDEVITITTRTARLKNAPTRVYDIRDLLDAPDAKGRAQQATDIIAVLMNLVRGKEEWAVTGPPTSLAGQIIVKALEEEHTHIVALLDKLREVKGISVSVEVAVLTVPEGFAEALGITLPDKKPMAATRPQNAIRGSFLDDFQASFLLKAVKADRDAKVLLAPRLTVRNGQQGTLSIGNEVPYITATKPVTTPDGKTEYEQQFANQFEGFRLEAQPTVSADRKFVTLKAKATQTRVLDMEKIPFKDAPADQKRFTQRPTLNVREIDTTVSIPDTGTLLLSVPQSRDEDEAGKAKSGQDILLLLKPTIIIKKPGEADQQFPLLRPAK